MTHKQWESSIWANLKAAKVQFERTIDCKHTEFDDLYPYMSEIPQFFWYKRYVAWQELITLTSLCVDFELDWHVQFEPHQIQFIEHKVLDAKVLDHWYAPDLQKESGGHHHKNN